MASLRSVLKSINPTSIVMVLDFDHNLLEEGFAGGILDDSLYLDYPVVFDDPKDLPRVLILGLRW